MKQEIIRLLRAEEGYISGQELSEHFGVSRTAVWKHIQTLKKEGYQIDSVSNKGYKLVSEPESINADSVKAYLKTSWAGTHIVYYAETDSTNIRAKLLGEEGAPHGTLVIAEAQSAGRGRRGRSWVSPPAEAVYMTLLLKPDIAAANASMLTLVSAMAICRAVNDALGSENRAGVKWPNDIVVNRKKVCGILTEMQVEADYVKQIVIGMGLNVNNRTFAPEIADCATSLKLESGHDCKRAQMIAAIMKYFEEYYDIFIKTEDMSGLKKEYEHMLINKGEQVRVIEAGKECIATAHGITNRGGLLVCDETQVVRVIFAGEVSIRGVLGYV